MLSLADLRNERASYASSRNYEQPYALFRSATSEIPKLFIDERGTAKRISLNSCSLKHFPKESHFMASEGSMGWYAESLHKKLPRTPASFSGLPAIKGTYDSFSTKVSSIRFFIKEYSLPGQGSQKQAHQ
jgi:hypothetical protein